MPRCRTIATIVLGLLACIVVASAAGAAPHKVYVERDIAGQELAYRPHAIFLSVDGTFAMTAIRYQSYGGEAAMATATADVRDCTPNCAQGRFFRPRARLRLSKQIGCRGLTIYSRLHYVLSGPLPSGFRHQGTESLRPVGEKGC